MSLYGLARCPMPVYGHIWFCMALNGLTQLCTIFVLVVVLYVPEIPPKVTGLVTLSGGGVGV